jgi:hypothetical protein
MVKKTVKTPVALMSLSDICTGLVTTGTALKNNLRTYMASAYYHVSAEGINFETQSAMIARLAAAYRHTMQSTKGDIEMDSAIVAVRRAILNVAPADYKFLRKAPSQTERAIADAAKAKAKKAGNAKLPNGATADKLPLKLAPTDGGSIAAPRAAVSLASPPVIRTRENFHAETEKLFAELELMAAMIPEKAKGRRHAVDGLKIVRAEFAKMKM